MTSAQYYFYPETAAGGFSRVDGTVEFYGRINALLTDDMTVLDFGAGRGRAYLDDAVPYRRNLRILKGKCRRVIGIDIDDAIRSNPGLDEALVLEPGAKLPLPPESVDLVVSDATFEHITDPELYMPELDRVLKPGGWICARTPGRWGYIGLGATMVPNRWHVRLLRYLQPHRKEIDVFPTAYKLNTRRALKRYFPLERYEHYTYGHFSEPAYFGNSKVAWRLALTVFRLLPGAFSPIWMIFLRKKGAKT
jgi:SAM-dependent methyltransferase